MIFPYSALLEVRQNRAAQQDRPQEIDLDRPHPFFPVDTLDGAAGPEDAGVVDQNVETAECSERMRRPASCTSWAMEISAHRAITDWPLPASLFSASAAFVQQLLVARADHHARTRFKILPRDFESQALARPGNDCASIRQ